MKRRPGQDSEEEDDNNGLGFVDEDSDDDDDNDEIDEAFDLNVTMDLLNAPFKKTDEFGYFNQQFRNFY